MFLSRWRYMETARCVPHCSLHVWVFFNDCGDLYMDPPPPQTWILQHTAPGLNNPAPQSSDLGQMLTCRRMEWQKCTSLLKAWGGWTRHSLCFAICLVQNVIQSRPYGRLSVQKLGFKDLEFSSCGSWSRSRTTCQRISVWSRLVYAGCEPLSSGRSYCPSKRFVRLYKICFRQHKTSRLLLQGLLFSLSTGACLCLPWTSLVQSVIVAVETFHLQFAGWNQPQALGLNLGLDAFRSSNILVWPAGVYNYIIREMSSRNYL